MFRTCALLSLTMFLFPCCTPVQHLTIDTHPPGATVTLTTYGVKEFRGAGHGIAVQAQGESFEDPPVQLGTTPLVVEIPLEVTETAVAIPGAAAQVAKVIREGLIRAELGGAVAERRVTFTGEPMVVVLDLAGVQP
jgi:hypothetical protein